MRFQNIGALVDGQRPATVPPNATVLEAAKEMAIKHVGAVAVMEGPKLVGLFTERDLLNRVVSVGKRPESVAVAEVMTPNPHTIRTDSSLVKALDIMFENRFRHLPVVDEAGTLLGVMSCRDIPWTYQALRDRWQASHNEPNAPTSGEHSQRPDRRYLASV